MLNSLWIAKCHRRLFDIGFSYIWDSPILTSTSNFTDTPSPMDVPMPVRKALMVDGENNIVNYLLHGEYELNKTSWSKLQKKYNVSRNKVYAALKGKGRPGGS